jgi:glycosyltransferase involved in cell wall biosynthesis
MSKSVLGVNGLRLVTPPSGVARAIEGILNALQHVPHGFDEIRVYTPTPIDPSVKLPETVINVVKGGGLPYGLWEQLVLPRLHGDHGLLLCPSYVAPMYARCPTLLIHHGSYEGYPEAFSPWKRFKSRQLYSMSCHAATRISTVSQHSKNDIVRFYGVEPEKINVIPGGLDTAIFRPITDSRLLIEWRRKILGEDLPFFLYVGKPTKRRNLPNLLHAFGEVKRKGRLPHKLIIIGSDLAGTDIAAQIEGLGLQDDVVCIGHADHKEIAIAYNASTALIYPSSYEGFGMPVLEAMGCGTPVVTLDNTAFPEFSKGVAMLLPNADKETLSEALRDVINNNEWRRRASSEGPIRAARYDWQVVTKEYVSLMHETVGL